MKKYRVLATALAAAAFLAGCGGSDAGNQSPRVAFTRMVNFGDSLSDVGTYATPVVAANGGGHYSINGDFSKAGLPFTNWTEYLSATLQLPAPPCPHEVGLASVGGLAFLNTSGVTVDATCFSYAQGGARVTEAVGPGNAVLAGPPYNSASGQLGQLTVPVVTQVATFNATNTFSDTDLVTVLAGGNDALFDRGVVVDGTVALANAQLAAGVIDLATHDAMISGAATQVVGMMTLAGTQLAALVKDQILAKGATHVVVVNLPDVSGTPDAAHWLTQGGGLVVEPLHPGLTLEMVNAFNTALATGLQVTNGESAVAGVVWVDSFASSHDQITNPAPYGLTNVTTPACNPLKTGLTVPTAGGPVFINLDSSLFCTKASLVDVDTANVTDTDPTGVLHYEFADSVHPTPFAYRLLAELVGLKMAQKGWL